MKGLTQFPSVLNNMAKQSELDFAVGRGLPQPKVRGHVGHSDIAGAGQGCRQSQIHAANDSRAANTADDCDSTGEPGRRLRPAIQPRGDLRIPVCDAWIQRGRCGGRERALIRCWSRARSAGRVAAGDGTPGDAIGRVAQWFTTTTRSTEIRPGTAATPVDTIPIATTAGTIRTAATPSTGMSSTGSERKHGQHQSRARCPEFRRQSLFRRELLGTPRQLGRKIHGLQRCSVDTLADLAAGLPEPTVLAAGEACTPAASAVSTAVASVGFTAVDDVSLSEVR